VAISELPLRVTRGACPHDCPDTCAWTVTVRDGRAVELQGDPDHPFTRGGLCAKVNHFLEDRTYHPDRVLRPLRRTGPKGAGTFEPVAWDIALDDIAGRLRGVVDERGAQAVMPSGWWASKTPSGSSANALTPDGISDLGRGGDFHSALVQVELAKSS
jgi:anaerobic selenocysteine-containing dehydrogenase